MRTVGRRLAALLLTPALLASLVASAQAAKDDLILVSRASGAAGAAGSDDSSEVWISANGRLVAFSSSADNLSGEDDNTVTNVFVRDFQANATTLVSRGSGASGPGGNAASGAASTSADGRLIAFSSSADNLSGEDVNALTNVFVRDLQANTTTLISRQSGATGPVADRPSYEPAISADGRFVAFSSSADNLSDEDGDVQDVFVRDRLTSTTTLVSRASAAGSADGTAGDAASLAPSISADGRFVAFVSLARNLSDDDRDATQDVFVRDLLTKTTTLVSRATDTQGAAAADADSRAPSISGDGQLVAFESGAANLGENNLNVQDIFVRDLQSRTTTLVSRASGAAGTPSDGWSGWASISVDGRFVAFESEANSLTDENRPGENIYVRDLQASTTAFVSRASGAAGAGGDGNSYSPSISGEGRSVAFDSEADNLSSEDNDAFRNVFARDLLGAPPGPASAPSPSPGPSAAGPTLLADSIGPAISASALARANGTIRVSRDGRLRLFCGRFAETVTGTCGGASVRRMRAGERRARLLKLGVRSFTARAGARAIIRFRLSRTSLKKLRAARTVRMNGIVVARDAVGNATTARFGFTLKAPVSRKREADGGDAKRARLPVRG